MTEFFHQHWHLVIGTVISALALLLFWWLALNGWAALAKILYKRGNTLLERHRPDAAIAYYERALRLKPDFADACYKRGNALLNLDQAENAVISFTRALQLKPDYIDALYNRGLALQRLKQPQAAVLSYDQVLSLKPDDAEALNNRGNALRDLQRFENALTSYDSALSYQPDYVDALHNRGLVLLDLKRPEDAVRSYTRLYELAPDYDFIEGKLLHAKMMCCDWEQFTSLTESIKEGVRTGKKVMDPFGYQGISNSAQDMKSCAELYAAEYYPKSLTQLWMGERYDNARIRIGYLSGEFRDQATSILMAELFELHDKTRFEIFAFDNGWDDASEMRRRLATTFDEMVDITSLGDIEAAAAIKQRQIDILVNLNGYFGRERQGIFSCKPCPVQVNYLGFPGTLGADYIDYIVADRQVIPPEHEAFYAEKVVYLPDTYQVNDSKRRIAQRAPSRAESGLPEQGFVFCCFNNNYKITPPVFDIWMRLLNKVTGSVLWLLEDNPAASRNLRRAACDRGVAPERVIFAPRISLDKHLARHGLADLFLDTLPSNAHTTASDALWAGLPLLTCMGGTFAGRVAGSLLTAIGLPDLTAHSLDDYEALALNLAANPARLADFRARLARNRATHPLFNADRFRRHIESAYTTMWERYRNGGLPVAFTVQPIQ